MSGAAPMDLAAVLEPSVHHGNDQVFFGARATCRKAGQTHGITIVGIDELDPLNGKISCFAGRARSSRRARTVARQAR